MNLTALSIRRPVTVLMILGAFVLFGIVAFTKLPVRRLPNVSYPFIRVVIGDPGASASTISSTVTSRVEDALTSETGILSMVGTSAPGRAEVAIQFVGGTNIDQKASSVALDLDKIARTLPATATAPSIIKANPSALPMMNVALSGPLASSQLFSLASTIVAPTLQEIPGVAQVSVVGGRPAVINIAVHNAALQAYGVTVPEVLTALKAENTSVTGGLTIAGNQELATKTEGGYASVQALQDLPIASRPGGAVLLSNLATVSPNLAAAQSFATLNGHPAVGLVITASSTANSLQVDNQIRSALAGMGEQLPPHVHTAITGDITNYTRAALANVEGDLALGIVMAGLVLLLFLRRITNTLIVMVAIPVSLVSTFAVMYFLGFSLDLISLMALSLLIGILVDDSIVVLENIHRHLMMGKDPDKAAVDGRMEIGAAAVAITLTDVVVYAPIAFLSGNVGQLFREFGLTIVAATLFSLLVSYTLTPMLAARWSARPAAVRSNVLTRAGDGFERGFEAMRSGYRRVIGWTLSHRILTFSLAVLSLIGTLAFVASGAIPTTFVPREDNGVFTVNATLPPGTPLSQSQATLASLSRHIQSMPGVTTVFLSSGYGGGVGAGHNIGQITADLAPRGERPTIYTFVKQVDKMARKYPGLKAHAHVQNPLIAAGARAAAINILGPNLDEVNTLAGAVLAQAQKNPAVTEVSDSVAAPTPEMTVSINHAVSAYLGVSTSAVGTTVSAALGAAAVPPIVPSSTQPAIPVQLSLAGSPDLTASQIAQIPVSAGVHGAVPLGLVARLAETPGSSKITQINREYAVSVSASSASGNVGPANQALLAAVQKVGLPTGYSYQVAGQAAQQALAFGPLIQALLLSIVLLYMLMAALYESFAEPFAILLSLPMATVGAFLGLWMTGLPLSIFSLLALIMLMGLVAKNAILLIDYTKTLRRRGMERNEAVIESGATRIRPIIMTTATMIGAMLPLAISHGSGSSERMPIAVVLIGGLTSSTLLTLLVVPVLYTMIDDAVQWLRTVVPHSRSAFAETHAQGVDNG